MRRAVSGSIINSAKIYKTRRRKCPFHPSGRNLMSWYLGDGRGRPTFDTEAWAIERSALRNMTRAFTDYRGIDPWIMLFRDNCRILFTTVAEKRRVWQTAGDTSLWCQRHMATGELVNLRLGSLCVKSCSLTLTNHVRFRPVGSGSAKR
jgi:hypothetical protein